MIGDVQRIVQYLCPGVVSPSYSHRGTYVSVNRVFHIEICSVACSVDRLQVCGSNAQSH